MRTKTYLTVVCVACLPIIIQSAFGQAGVPLWTNLFSAPFSPYDGAKTLVADSLGHFYVAGHDRPSNNASFATVKFTRDGFPLWTNLFRLANHEFNAASSITIGSNVVCVTGFSLLKEFGSNQPTFATIQYSAAGLANWTNLFKASCNIAADGVVDGGYTTTTMDGDGNTYVTCAVYGFEERLTNDFQIIKFSSSGAPIWTNRHDGSAHGNDAIASAKILPSGRVVVTGSSATASNGSEIVTIAYADTGMALWTNRFTGAGKAYSYDLGADENGNVYVSGITGVGGIPTYDRVILAYGDSGTSLWTNYLGRQSGVADLGGPIIVKDGKVVATGSTHSSTILAWAVFDFATAAYNYSGFPLWTNYYGSSGQSPDSRDDRPFAVAMDNAGNAYVTGWSSFPGQYSAAPDWATVGYAGDGAPVWTNWFRSSFGSGYDSPNQLTVDSEGNVIVVGRQQLSYSYAGTVIIKYAGVSPSPVPLTIQQAGQDLVLSWPDNRFVLQSAPAATGVFNPVFGATSPYTNSPNIMAQFFRLMAN